MFSSLISCVFLENFSDFLKDTCPPGAQVATPRHTDGGLPRFFIWRESKKALIWKNLNKKAVLALKKDKTC